jgi:CBS domain-containing protein
MESIGSIVQGRETVVVGPSTTVAEASRLMTDRGIGAVPVLEETRLIGIFTERDVMAKVVAEGRDPQDTPVRDVMSTELIVAEAGAGIEDCLRRLHQARVRHLLVLKEGRLVGIASMRDLVVRELSEKDRTIELLNAYIHYIPADLSPPADEPG